MVAERANGPGTDHILCWVCAGPIHQAEYAVASCWADPAGITVAAHSRCLVALGEQDLNLR